MTAQSRKPAVNKLLTGPEAAERLGLTPATWRSYVAKGYAPAANDPGDVGQPANRRAPRWLTSVIDHFAANRIGRGKRSTTNNETEKSA